MGSPVSFVAFWAAGVDVEYFGLAEMPLPRAPESVIAEQIRPHVTPSRFTEYLSYFRA